MGTVLDVGAGKDLAWSSGGERKFTVRKPLPDSTSALIEMAPPTEA
jgi:hypothetical protein